MTREHIIAVLRQSWRELDAEASATADNLGDVVLALAAEWHIELQWDDQWEYDRPSGRQELEP